MDILLYFFAIPLIFVIIIKAIVSDSGSSKNLTLYNYRYNRKYNIMTEQERIRRDLIVNDIFKKANFPLLRVDSIKIDNEKLKQIILENIKNIVK